MHALRQPAAHRQEVEFDVLNRLRARGATAKHGNDARQLVDRINLVEISGQVLSRAFLPLTLPMNTLDALHLATMAFLREQGLTPAPATCDQRMVAACSSGL